MNFIVLSAFAHGSASARCDALFKSKSEAPHWPPPHEIPPELLARYTMNGTSKVVDWIADHKANGNAVSHWETNQIEQIMTACQQLPASTTSGRAAHNRPWRQNGQWYQHVLDYVANWIDPAPSFPLCECYQTGVCWEALSAFREEIRDSRAIVIGSQSPWAEAMLLALRARHVTSIEWQNTTLRGSSRAIKNRWVWMHPARVASQYLHGKWHPADVAFSYSSLEHDGLGRYGDPLNPEGDLLSVEKVACLLKPGGLFFLGVPVGGDALAWNAHRIYGSARLRLVFRGWRLLTLYGTSDVWDDQATRVKGLRTYPPHPIFVMQKPE